MTDHIHNRPHSLQTMFMTDPIHYRPCS